MQTTSGTSGLERRLDVARVAPQAYRAQRELESYVRGSGLDPTLLELVRLRASYMNGCAYCVDMHSKDARAAGETEQRLYSLGAWRETPWFSDAERAALALTEAVTLLHDGHVPRPVFEEAAQHFEPEPLAQLISLLVAVNAWNRIGVTTRCWEPGSYESDG